jgi:prephenate dehydratase
LTTLRVGYFGPEGTFTHEALIDSTADLGLDQVPYPTIYDAVMAVQRGEVDRALVPIENSLEGSVNATLDTLAIETQDVAIVGELVHPIRHCLIARTQLELSEIETVVSHPQANAQCARFIRTHLPAARVLAGASTAEAVRIVAEHEGPWAALGTRLAAERHGCQVLRAGVEDGALNETRFVWLARTGAPPAPARPAVSRRDARQTALHRKAGRGGSAPPISTQSQPPEMRDDRPRVLPGWKTAIVFWGEGSETPGWLVRCLAELADRQVNLTRIESRPLKQALGQYMFFVDLEGRDADRPVIEALEALRERVAVLRVLGSFPVG